MGEAAVRGLSPYAVSASLLSSLELKLRSCVSPVDYKLPEDKAISDSFLYSSENLGLLSRFSKYVLSSIK